VGRLLKQQNKTIGTAESCTGGGIAYALTSVPGSSAYFMGSVVSYDNRIKQELLGVKKETLDTYGAVSEESVREMLQGALQQLKTDYAVAVSGIMGPDGGTEEKPAGTVWVAVGNKDKTATHCFHFRFDRERNTRQTVMSTLDFLRKFIVANA
jgi:nicotinamide-nucleotide amidase